MRNRYDNMSRNYSDDIMLLPHRDKSKDNIYTLPQYYGIGTVICLVLSYVIIYYIDNDLPTALKKSDEAIYPNAFIAERASEDVRILNGLGPRVTGGSTNEIQAFHYMIGRIDGIIANAHPNQKLERDVQLVSGAYNWARQRNGGVIVAYSNVQNVVAKLHGKNNESILINAHYDSVPTSLGASDDAINIATMLEVLRILSKSPDRPTNSIVFLFNGAEETGLQASHGFVTHHPWAHDCRVVINLEACGLGGKIILFQTGPSASWLLKYYTSVPFPYGQVAGEEIFQSGFIPSDTDFRIFRDYGKMVGYDMAFYKDGYRYHTRHDDFRYLPDGSYQNVGENVLALTRNLAEAPEILSLNVEGKAIYYDFLGLFMISYNETVALILNLSLIILSVLSFLKCIHDFRLGGKSLKLLVMISGAIVLGWILSFAFLFLLSFSLDGMEKTMTWFCNTWLLVGLYVLPTISLTCATIHLISFDRITLNIQCQLQIHVMRLIWTLVLAIGALLRIRAVYVFTIYLMCDNLAFLLIYVFKWQYTVRKWLITYILMMCIPVIMLMYTSLITLSMFVPLTGRMGSDKNVELLIGGMCLVFTIVGMAPFVAVSNLLRKPGRFQLVICSSALVFFVLIFTSSGFPYSGNYRSPKHERFFIMHTSRVFRNEMNQEYKNDSGFFVCNLDRNAPRLISNYVEEFSKSLSPEDDCKDQIFCGFPIFSPLMISNLKKNTWIPAAQPIIPEKTQLEVVDKIFHSKTKITYNISINGPDRIYVFLSPRQGVKVINLSILDDVPSDPIIWNDRPVYFLYHIYGKFNQSFDFNFTIHLPAEYNEKLPVELGIVGLHVHDKQNIKVPSYRAFLEQFPWWAYVVSWIATYDSYFV